MKLVRVYDEFGNFIKNTNNSLNNYWTDAAYLYLLVDKYIVLRKRSMRDEERFVFDILIASDISYQKSLKDATEEDLSRYSIDISKIKLTYAGKKSDILSFGKNNLSGKFAFNFLARLENISYLESTDEFYLCKLSEFIAFLDYGASAELFNVNESKSGVYLTEENFSNHDRLYLRQMGHILTRQKNGEEDGHMG